jgi:hypothetical protein
MLPNGKMSPGTLMGGGTGIQAEYQKFYSKKESDSKNEAFPLLSRRLSQKTLLKLNI